MDINEIRMRNYAVLFRRFRDLEAERGEPERGSLNRFGLFTGVSARYLSHVNNGRKVIGAESARKMEAAFGLPHGWMDNDHLAGPAPNTRAEREYLELALKLFRDSPVDAQAVLLRYMGERVLSRRFASEGEAGVGEVLGRTLKRNATVGDE